MRIRALREAPKTYKLLIQSVTGRTENTQRTPRPAPFISLQPNPKGLLYWLQPCFSPEYLLYKVQS
jgi:hypothetical protein